MKGINKHLVITIAATLLYLHASAQGKKSSDKCVTQGTIILDAYYGYPYVMGSIIKDHSQSANITNEKIINYNHIGGKAEYMVSDMVGMGVDYTFAKVTDTYVDSYTATANGQSVVSYRTFNESLIKQRILLKVNIHFATTNQLDPYATAGLGYKYTSFKTDNPRYANTNLSFFNAFPVAFRMGAGIRWYFTDIIGICAEAGIGGPILQGGITAKF